jgi:hypothetical protein
MSEFIQRRRASLATPAGSPGGISALEYSVGLKYEERRTKLPLLWASFAAAHSRATALESPEDLLALIRSGDPGMRLKLKSEIRKRISRIEVSFGLDGFEAVADVKFYQRRLPGGNLRRGADAPFARGGQPLTARFRLGLVGLGERRVHAPATGGLCRNLGLTRPTSRGQPGIRFLTAVWDDADAPPEVIPIVLEECNAYKQPQVYPSRHSCIRNI